jgi:hypothetical protein
MQLAAHPSYDTNIQKCSYIKIKNPSLLKNGEGFLFNYELNIIIKCKLEWMRPEGNFLNLVFLLIINIS